MSKERMAQAVCSALQEQVWATLRPVLGDIERIAETGEPADDRDKALIRACMGLIVAETQKRKADCDLDDEQPLELDPG